MGRNRDLHMLEASIPQVFGYNLPTVVIRRFVTAGGQLERWTSARCFLLAPLEQSNRILVLRPPKVLISAGIVHPQELWYATGAIYGLREAPAAWSAYRDSELPNIQIQHEHECFKLVRSRADQNLWHVRSIRG